MIVLMGEKRHTFIAHSQNITMTNMDMNATSNSQYKTVNTDGTDTWNSKDIVISNWTVTYGDVSKLITTFRILFPGDSSLTFQYRTASQSKEATLMSM